MGIPASESPIAEQKIPTEYKFIKRGELSPLLAALSKSTHVGIRLKRIDRINYGNFSTVVRATGALIMLREITSGAAEVIPDLRNVQQFQLTQDFLNFKADTVYEIVL